MVLTPIEVRDNSFLKDTNIICDLIFLDQEIICECFGMDFYDRLVDSLVVHEAPEWHDRIYKENDLVYYEGYFYRSLTNRNRSNPTDTECWVKLEKFNDKCLNSIWPILKKWLSNEIAIRGVRLLGFKIGKNGIQENIDNESNTRRASDYNYRQSTQLQKELNESRLNLLAKKMEKLDCNFPKLKCCKGIYKVWRDSRSGLYTTQSWLRTWI